MVIGHCVFYFISEFLFQNINLVLVARVVVFFHHHHDLVVSWLLIIFSCQAIFSIFFIFLLLSF